MGREVRMVPAGWEHPKDASGNFIPLLGRSYSEDAAEFNAIASDRGKQEAIDYFGSEPEPDSYMPDFPEGTATHYMMYEDCSEGTPISPAFATPEELARWLADNKASAFGGRTAPYESWLRVCNGGWAPSAIVSNGVMTSGVEGVSK
jgi:hypothetical protein